MRKFLCVRKDTPDIEGWENWFSVGEIYDEYNGFLKVFKHKELLKLYSKNSFGKRTSPFMVNDQCFVEVKFPEKIKSLTFKTAKGTVIELYDFTSLTITRFINQEFHSSNKFDSDAELEDELKYLHRTLHENNSNFEYVDYSIDPA